MREGISIRMSLPLGANGDGCLGVLVGRGVPTDSSVEDRLSPCIIADSNRVSSNA